GRRTLLTALAGRAENRVVGAADGRRERVGLRLSGARAKERRSERIDRGGARHLASGLASDAVGDGEERRVSAFADEVPVFVVLTHPAGVGECGGSCWQPLVPLLGAVLPRDVEQIRLRAARHRRACRRILPDHRALASLALGGSPFDDREAGGLERADGVGQLLPDDVRRARYGGARRGGSVRAGERALRE